MDLNFHYFAVKTLAVEAGFDQEEAQVIAAFSQMVDDFNYYAFMSLKSLPDYVKAAPLDLCIKSPLNPCNFNPATTGTSDIGDYLTLITERSQRFTESAFHFLPAMREAKRTQPAHLGDGSLADERLQDAAGEYRRIPVAGRRRALMQIGIALHTFADTYAHALFTGYNSWENDVQLVCATDNITGEDVTKESGTEIVAFLHDLRAISGCAVPAIGHMYLGHVPDLSHLSFSMRYREQKDGPEKIYTRSNTDAFMTAARETYRLMCGLTEKAPTAFAAIEERLRAGFLFRFPDAEAPAVEALSAHWQALFPQCRYAYSSSGMKRDFFGTKAQADGIRSASEDFYRFNEAADRCLVALYGPEPRRTWYNEIYMEQKSED